MAEQQVNHQRWSLLEFMQRQSWRCPKCHETWVVFNTSKQMLHICKRCGYRFTVKDRKLPNAA